MRARLFVGAVLFTTVSLIYTSVAQAQFGRGGRGGDRGGRGGFSRGGFGRGGFDPQAMMKGMMDRVFGGKNEIRISELSGMSKMMVSRMMERAGIKGDTISRSQIEGYLKQRMSSGGFGGRGGDRGGDRGGRSSAPTSKEDQAKQDARTAESFFRRSDRNGDGVLNYEEMSSTLKREKSKWDANKDGLISQTEYGQYIKGFLEKRRQEQKAREGDKKDEKKDSTVGGLAPGASIKTNEDLYKELDKKPTVYRVDGELPDGLPSWFREYDKNKDSQIALYEWKEARQKLSDFESYDRNGDAFLTVEEVLYKTALARGEKPGEKKDEKSSSSSGSSRWSRFGRGGSSSGGSSPWSRFSRGRSSSGGDSGRSSYGRSRYGRSRGR